MQASVIGGVAAVAINAVLLITKLRVTKYAGNSSFMNATSSIRKEKNVPRRLISENQAAFLLIVRTTY